MVGMAPEGRNGSLNVLVLGVTREPQGPRGGWIDLAAIQGSP